MYLVKNLGYPDTNLVYTGVYAFMNTATKRDTGFRNTFLRYLAVGVGFSFTAVQRLSGRVNYMR